MVDVIELRNMRGTKCMIMYQEQHMTIYRYR
jgi:hypothetical protein